MRKSIFAVVSLALVLAGCSSGSVSAPQIFTDACLGLTTANNAFQAASPALIAAGKLNQNQVAQEKAIFAVASAECASPPIDPTTGAVNYPQLATSIIADAGAIYLIIAQPAAAHPAAAAVYRH